MLSGYPTVVLVFKTDNCPSSFNGFEVALRITIEQLIESAFELTAHEGGGFVTLEISLQEYEGGTCYLSREIPSSSYIVVSIIRYRSWARRRKIKSFFGHFLCKRKLRV
jgi:hypothetical protein